MTRTTRRRNGTILPLVAISLVALVGLVAMAVDIGLVTVARTKRKTPPISALAERGCSMATPVIPAI